MNFYEPRCNDSEPVTNGGISPDDHRSIVDPDIIRMNASFAVVNVSGKARVSQWDGKRWQFSTFRDFELLTDNIPKEIISQDKEGKPIKKIIGIGRWWLKQPDRLQFDGVTFAPGNDQNPDGMMNLWTGWACQPAPGDCSKYLAHLKDNVCAGNEKHYKYLLDVMADAVKNPHKRGEVAVVLRSQDEGTGKGMAIKHFGKLFGNHYVHVSQPSHLTGKFNSHLETCCVLFADECLVPNDKHHEGVLKYIISEENLVIERKGLDAISVLNCLHLFIASNNDWVVPAGPTARRYFVLDVLPTKKQDRKYFAAIEKEMNDGGREALLYELLARDLSNVDICDVPQTKALAEQKALSRRGIDLVIETLAYDGVLPCCHDIYPDVAITGGEGKGEGFYAEIKGMVPDLKQIGSIVISRKLKEWGCARWKSNGRTGLKFPPLDELRSRFDKKHGKQDWPDTDAWTLPARTDTVFGTY